MLRLDFAGGIGAVKAFVDAVNLYVTEQEPWVLAKDDGERRAALDRALHDLRVAARDRGAAPRRDAQGDRVAVGALGAAEALGPIGEQVVTDAGRWGQLPAGTRVTKGAILFPRLEDAAA